MTDNEIRAKLEKNNGFIDIDSVSWITTVGYQLEQNNATRSTPGYEAWKDLEDSTIIVMHDDGEWDLY